jgi:hypothetical protein
MTDEWTPEELTVLDKYYYYSIKGYKITESYTFYQNIKKIHILYSIQCRTVIRRLLKSSRIPDDICRLIQPFLGFNSININNINLRYNSFIRNLNYGRKIQEIFT